MEIESDISQENSSIKTPSTFNQQISDSLAKESNSQSETELVSTRNLRRKFLMDINSNELNKLST